MSKVELTHIIRVEAKHLMEEDIFQVLIVWDSEVEEMVNCFVLPLFGGAFFHEKEER